MGLTILLASLDLDFSPYFFMWIFINSCFLIHRTSSNVFFLSTTFLVDIFSIASNIFVFSSVSFFLRLAFVAVSVAMICLSPLVEFSIFSIAFSASFLFRGSPYYVAMALFAWYHSGFDVYWDSRRSWWAVVKYVFKLSHIFCAVGFLLKSVQSSLNIAFFNTRLYAAEIIFLGVRGFTWLMCSL